MDDLLGTQSSSPVPAPPPFPLTYVFFHHRTPKHPHDFVFRLLLVVGAPPAAFSQDGVDGLLPMGGDQSLPPDTNTPPSSLGLNFLATEHCDRLPPGAQAPCNAVERHPPPPLCFGQKDSPIFQFPLPYCADPRVRSLPSFFTCSPFKGFSHGFWENRNRTFFLRSSVAPDPGRSRFPRRK